ncbi:dihydroorotase [Rhodospirillum rubrum]|uniref:Dihydroorotase n=1 Tax=Rhodospirillum rubrum (strain ATCC 11170 / ATH 1.1.1 / DSM 467 / LMG 4362 / NCIMB 8255 / S1) TaxID=269796 RepID=Q2RPF9_RHORT|nr:dihydroorotase [Rhodospirillum rubrum]ABC23986.1 dihydroorotase [Rhodospirillum rubrum ATCC 11170]AEO49731.1 dihydroorotase [Rhodospirillum rubrum F11]MBK5955670.1 dihydroorotase [Rhodospirillum rubrum]QXG79928.1 dihydroorotase [Rhodospirillum rubrum]HAP99347.1 dihydroorotase [Rhodospirillum rubrum]
MSLRSPGRVAYVNARLLDPASGLDQTGALLADGEHIVEVHPGAFTAPEDAEIIDCQGACLAPGLVDMRVQLREPGEEHKESMRSAGQAAVAGGITSMVCLPNTNPPMDDEATLEFVARRARLAGLAKVYCYGACTKGLRGEDLAELGIMAEAGALAFTDGVKAIANAQMMRRVLAYAATFDLLVMQHPEEPTLAGGVMNAGDLATRMGLSGIPREAEIILLERDLRLVAMTGGRYHAAHISTGESVALIRRAKDQGLRVSCDTAPFYFALNELAVGDYRTFAKLSPPLRGESDRRAIIEGLKDGVIDAIASDHSPQDQDTKRLPFAQAAFGAVGLETLLSISLELHHNGHLSLLEVLKRLTVAPAGLLGLDAGRLRPGGKADLLVFDPYRAGKVDATRFLSKSKNSPFDDRPVQGRVLRTVVDGRTVFPANG